jgi:hypothetical protein
MRPVGFILAWCENLHESFVEMNYFVLNQDYA